MTRGRGKNARSKIQNERVRMERNHVISIYRVFFLSVQVQRVRLRKTQIISWNSRVCTRSEEDENLTLLSNFFTGREKQPCWSYTSIQRVPYVTFIEAKRIYVYIIYTA